MNLIETETNISSEFTLPSGIEVNIPFDGKLLGGNVFEPGRTYLIQPMTEGMWPVVMYPLPESEEPVFEASLFTCMLLTGDLRVILCEEYYNPEIFDPIATDWIARKLINKAKKADKRRGEK